MADETDAQETTERSKEPERLTGIRFDDFPIPTEILAGLKDLGNIYCTPIQAEILPLVLPGRMWFAWLEPVPEKLRRFSSPSLLESLPSPTEKLAFPPL
jgi:hypothetical protein